MTHPVGVDPDARTYVAPGWGSSPWGAFTGFGQPQHEAQEVYRSPTVVMRKGRPKRKVVR